MSLEVAIIGAGLSGLTLALALHQQGIASTVYESRAAPLNIGGAIMLSPNALKITDALGFYDAISTRGFNFELLDYQTSSGKLIDTYEFGSESKYGYKANRIYRYELIDAVLARLREFNIPVKYGHKYSHVVSETAESVTFAFTDGTEKTVALLVGADGIHSTVRKYLHPGLEPKFTGMAGITAAVPTSQVKFNAPLTRPLTILDKTLGAFVIAPQRLDSSEMFIGKQKRVPEEPTREGWDAMHADKAASVAFLQKDAEIFGDIAVSATSRIPHETINIWPFYVIPKLSHWTSEQRRVVILGDAAHAIPPSAGQGINQAFEDVYIFALLLGASKVEKINTADAMHFWQEYRQDRIDRVLDLNKHIDARRVPSKETAALGEQEFDLRWLYEPDFKAIVKGWVDAKTSV